jgi:hypothetical protein
MDRSAAVISIQQQVNKLYAISEPEAGTPPPSGSEGFFFNPRLGHRLIIEATIAPADHGTIKGGWAEARLAGDSPLSFLIALRFRDQNHVTCWFKVPYSWHTDRGKHRPLAVQDAALLPTAARKLAVIFKANGETVLERSLLLDPLTALRINTLADASMNANYRPGWPERQAAILAKTAIAPTPDPRSETAGYAIDLAPPPAPEEA